MRNEIDSITETLNDVLYGEPWFGRPVFSILNEIHPALVYKKPNEDAHSLIDLVYHMITWADFTLKNLQGNAKGGVEESEQLDWRNIDPLEHTWARGLSELKSIHKEITELLKQKDDSILDQPVEFRTYNFRFLLNGLIQHNIYHLGQIAYVKKWLIPE